MDYSPLFQSLTLKNLKLKNRLVMAPMTTTSGNEDSSFSDEEIKYLAQRAEAGIGLVMTPACFCHKSGHSFERQVGCHDDAMLARMAACAEAINRNGAASFLQIFHGGAAAKESYTGRPPLAPSPVKNRRGTSERPKEMTEVEIMMIVEAFAKAAGRAKKAGFTGIELHGANSYLFQQFFSPFMNRRNDRWGGDTSGTGGSHLENRARFAVQVIKAVRAEVGREYPISYRISPEEPDPLGYSTYDTIALLKILVPYGIDIIHVSSLEYGKSIRNDIPRGSHPTYLIKEAFPYLPVIGVGKIIQPIQALRVLEEGVLLVALGRGLLLDKDWARKVSEGAIDQIRMGIATEEERYELEIPERMREYTKRSIPAAGH